jgi:hypothetical protein
MTRPGLEPFGDDGELARLLEAERAALEPDRATRDRMWARLAASLMVPPPPRPLGAGKVLVAVAAAGVIAQLAWWQARPRSHALAPVTIAAPTIAVPAPAAPAPSGTVPAATGPAAGRESALPPPPLHERDLRRPRARPIDALAQEQRLIDEARDALAHGQPRDASAALAEHARRFVRGQLAEERESLAVRAELTMGQSAQAHARAVAFLALYPDSLFAPVVRALAARATASAPDAP